MKNWIFAQGQSRKKNGEREKREEGQRKKINLRGIKSVNQAQKMFHQAFVSNMASADRVSQTQ